MARIDDVAAWKDATSETTTWLLWASAVETAAVRKGASGEIIRSSERIRRIMSRAFQYGEPVWMAADEVVFIAKAEARPRSGESASEHLREAMKASERARRGRDEAVPSSRRGAKRGYRFEVASALIRNHRLAPERAFRLVEKWGGLVDLRMHERRSPLSTAEHVERFERQGIVSPFAGRDARKRPFRRCTRGMEVQTLIFPGGFGERRAKRWAKGHDYRFGKVDVSRSTGSIRLRQREPIDFVDGSFRTITVDDRAGVQAVVGCPKRGRESDVTKRR